MSCSEELKKLHLEAPEPPEVDPETRRTSSAFRAGYIHGFQDAVREALAIVEDHEEED